MKQYKQKTTKLLSYLLTIAMVIGMLQGIGTVAFAASASDYTGVSYKAAARVDESVGLRGEVKITGGAVPVEGISPKNTDPTKSTDISNSGGFSIKVTPKPGYDLTKIVVAAIAEITHSDGTMDAAKHINETLDVNDAVASGVAYTVPSFKDRVVAGDKIDVQVTVYADFTYTVPAVIDYTIVVGDNIATPGAPGAVSNIVINDSGNNPITSVNGLKIWTDINGNTTANNNSPGIVHIDVNELTSALGHIPTIKLTGNTRSTASAGDNNAVVIENASHSANRHINVILDDVEIRPSPGSKAGLSDAKTHSNGIKGRRSNIFVTSRSSNLTDDNRTSGSSRNKYSSSALSLSDVDAYVTLLGSSSDGNILASASSNHDSGGEGQAGIYVDASASLIITDKSTGKLYARGGGCTSAIGSSGAHPAGYVEIDGGTVTAESANSQHKYAGIGNGGHYSSATDPGIRGIVINKGTVNALGFHYGLGGNGGSSAYNTNLRNTYVNITGGNVTSESSAGSQGATVGFAYQNDRHNIRIGRPDMLGKSDDVTLDAINWGYGAAISGIMTFYSGTTKAYSGQYAAAIGGCAISNADIREPYDTDVANIGTGSSDSTVIGTPLTVYGGNIKAQSGAFIQKRYSTNVTEIRGTGRTDASSVNSEASGPRKFPSYGAAIGGAISKSGGTKNKIFAGRIDVISSTHGAGIGGGGNRDGVSAVGGGGETWFGSMKSSSGNSTSALSFSADSPDYLDTTATTPPYPIPNPAPAVTDGNTETFGAGIGGGGSKTSSGGNGGNVHISGTDNTVFNITGSTYGAAIGGGGSKNSSAGSGGNVDISGGSFEIISGKHAAGLGGGGSEKSAGGSGGRLTVTDGNFKVTMGNYGAGIGGGGSANAGGGSATGDVKISGGSFTIAPQSGAEDITFGAGIGGGGSGGKGGGGKSGSLTISKDANSPSGTYAYTKPSFTVRSGDYGAGIGGGGSKEGNGGDFGNGKVNISGGIFTVESGLYGSGIGGGGSGGAGKGGDGTQDFTATGGIFHSNSKGVGAGIGGGGSQSGKGGKGGIAVYNGGTVEVSVPMMRNADGEDEGQFYSVGMGGGATRAGADFSKTDPDLEEAARVASHETTATGKVTVTGGNIYTIVSSVPDSTRPDMHAYTQPYPVTAKNPGDPLTMTGRGIAIPMNKKYINSLVKDVAFKYAGGDFNGNSANGYRVNDMYVTKNAQGNGEVWVWVPAEYKINYNFGKAKPEYGTGFKFEYLDRYGVGRVSITTDLDTGSETYDGDDKDVIDWNYQFEPGKVFDGAAWSEFTGTKSLSAELQSAEPKASLMAAPFESMKLYELVDHPKDSGMDVVLAGFGTVPPKKIYAAGDNIESDVLQNGEELQVTQSDITLYAYYGYDTTGTGMPDVRETGETLTYNTKGGLSDADHSQLTGVPTDTEKYLMDDVAGIDTVVPKIPKRIFMGYKASKTGAEFKPGEGVLGAEHTFADLIKPGGILDPAALYLPSSTMNVPGTSEVLTGMNKYTFTTEAVVMNAVWALDDNGNGIPDMFEQRVNLKHHMNYGTPLTTDKLCLDSNPGESYDFNNIPGYTTTEGMPLAKAADGVGIVAVGWSETPMVGDYIADKALLPADLANPLTTASPMAGVEQNVYLIWAKDLDEDGVPDYDQGEFSFLFNTNTTATVNGSLQHSRRYTKDEVADAGDLNPKLEPLIDANGDVVRDHKTASNVALDRPGWTILGWTDNLTSGTITEYTTAIGQATPPAHSQFLTDASTKKFDTTDITVYAIWAEDKNNNDIPDWMEHDGRSAVYYPSVGTDPSKEDFRTIVENSMPFYNSYPKKYVDDGSASGNKYTNMDEVTMSSSVPRVREGDRIFMGWVPSLSMNTMIKDSGTARQDFFRSLVEIMDIREGNNLSGFNVTETTKAPRHQLGLEVKNPSNNATLFEDLYDELVGIVGAGGTAGDDDILSVYGKDTIDWKSLTGYGYLESVRFDYWYPDDFSADPNNPVREVDLVNKIPAAGKVKPEDAEFPLVAVWAEDNNKNGIADFLEDGLSLFYELNANYDPATSLYSPGELKMQINKIGTARAGQTMELESVGNDNISRVPYKKDSKNHDVRLVGWASEENMPTKEVYTFEDRGSRPPITRSVTFGDSDKTVYAIWGVDDNENGKADVIEDPVIVRYDANGGESDPNLKDEMFPDGYLEGANKVAIINVVPQSSPGANHVFIGWTTDTSALGKVYSENDINDLTALSDLYQGGDYMYNIRRDTTLYAIWGEDADNDGKPDITSDRGFVKYNGNGGDPVPNTTIGMDGESLTLNTSVKPTHSSDANYMFLGWSLEVYPVLKAGDEHPALVKDVTVEAGKVITVYAVYSQDRNINTEPDVYEDAREIIYFDDGTGIPPKDMEKYLDGEEAEVLEGTQLENPGYELVGWSTEPDGGGTIYKPGDKIELNGDDVTLYPVWEKKGDPVEPPEDEYTLSYNATGGTNQPPSTTHEAGEVTNVSTQVPVRTDYKFVEWNTERYTNGDSYAPGARITINSDITLFARWEWDGIGDAPELEVVYKDKDGWDNIPEDLLTYEPGDEAVISDKRPTNPDFEFIGWNTDPEGKGEWFYPGDKITVGSEDLVLYPVGKPISTTDKTITYDKSDGENIPVDNGKYKEGDTATISDQIPTKPGYTFEGWNTKPDGSGADYKPGDKLTIGKENVTLYPKWSKNDSNGGNGGNGGGNGGGGGGGGNTGGTTTKSVTYNANGGTGSHKVSGVKNNSEHTVLTLDATGISRNGYTFEGWNTKSDGSGDSYASGDKVKVSSDLTLYAQWKDDGTGGEGPGDGNGGEDPGNGNEPETPGTLEKTEHRTYLNGYPEGGVNSEGNMTRAEAASVFFRLLSDKEHSDKNTPVANKFTDMDGTEWYAQAVNYMVSKEFINGYANGTFGPNNQITRAEFATLASKFAKLSENPENRFNDVSGHWAEKYINSAAEKGWINGYSDGGFRPENPIMRGEVVTMVNRMLERKIDAEALAQIKNPFNDITPTHWAYAEIIEASYAHEYEKDDNKVEHWTQW